MLNTGILIQARLGSKRLPSKMVLPFYNEMGVLEFLFYRLSQRFVKIPIILVTTNNKIDDILVELAINYNIKTFRGDEANVLQRFISAAEHFSLSQVIRICADNPFLDLDGLEILVTEEYSTKLEYWSFQTSSGIPSIKTHFGFWAEGISLKALQKIARSTSEQQYLEHVTNFIYTHKEDFEIKLREIPKYVEELSDLRLTLDTYEDYTLLRDIVSKSCDNFSTSDIIQLVKENSIWLDKMRINKNENEK